MAYSTCPSDYCTCNSFNLDFYTFNAKNIFFTFSIGTVYLYINTDSLCRNRTVNLPLLRLSAPHYLVGGCISSMYHYSYRTYHSTLQKKTARSSTAETAFLIKKQEDLLLYSQILLLFYIYYVHSGNIRRINGRKYRFKFAPIKRI